MLCAHSNPVKEQKLPAWEVRANILCRKRSATRGKCKLRAGEGMVWFAACGRGRAGPGEFPASRGRGAVVIRQPVEIKSTF